ncbi:MAG TPA: hypothetical protein VLG40_00605 [Candidatus Saccharimonas sp.]|nr:hypothetical protein [Candidatus Saccharimonas sp.]
MSDNTSTHKSETFDELERELSKDMPATKPPEPIAGEPLPAQLRRRANQSKDVHIDDISEDELAAAAAATENDDLQNQTASQTDADPLNESAKLQTKSRPGSSSELLPKKRHFWRRKKFWFTTGFLLVVILAFAWFIAPSRYVIVNALGLRGTVTVKTIIAAGDNQPTSLLKQVTVMLNNAQWQTDAYGNLNAKVPYGEYAVTAKKLGYSTASQQVEVDFDPFFHLLGTKSEAPPPSLTMQLKAIGIPLTIHARDWLTGSPITYGAFTIGQQIARPNQQGDVSVTLSPTDVTTATVMATFGGGYTDKQFTVQLNDAQPTITFVPEGTDYFISNRNGVPTIYSSNLDGSNAVQFLAPAANETAAMAIAVSPSGKYAALASTRSGVRDAQGNLLQQLFVVDLSNKNLTSVDQAQWFNFVDWQDDMLVYTASGISGAQRLASVNTVTATRTNLATAATFGIVRVALNSVAYQRSAAAGDATASQNPELRVVNIKGGTEKSLGYNVQQLAEADPQTLAFQVGDGTWRNYNANTLQIKTAAAPPSAAKAYLATASPDGQTRIALDTIDGKPVIIARNVGSGQEKQLYTASGITGPLRILDGQVLFRIADGSQTADYILSLTGGMPKKIADVTAPVLPFTRPTSYVTFF